MQITPCLALAEFSWFFYGIKLFIIKEGAWQGLVEKIIQLVFSHQGL